MSQTQSNSIDRRSEDASTSVAGSSSGRGVGAPPSRPPSNLTRQLHTNTLEIGRLQQEAIELKGRVRQLEEEQEDNRDKAGVLHARVATLESALQSLLKGLKKAAKGDVAVAAVEGDGIGVLGDGNGEGDGGTGGDQAIDEEAKQERASVAASAKAAKDKSITKAIASAYLHLLGVGTVVPGTLLDKAPYPTHLPDGVTYDHDDWPLDPRSNGEIKIFRLDFQASDGVLSPKNATQIDLLVKYVKNNGHTFCPEATTPLQSIKLNDLRPLVIAKFKYIANVQKVALKTKQAHAEGARNLEEDEDTTPQVLISRASSMAKQMLRKRSALPDELPWRHAKYDSAFVAELLPRHDEQRDQDGNKEFVLRRPSYWSTEIWTLHDDFAELPDPIPNKANDLVRRIAGDDIINAKPRKAVTLARRTRSWMVDAAVLASNLTWLKSDRVALSGDMWDEEEPEEPKPKKKRELALSGECDSFSKRIKLETVLESLGNDMETAMVCPGTVVEKVIGNRNMNELFWGDGDEEGSGFD
ncbi:hypothetical protein FRB95_001601 [Tulasnella sp. JGI-2019a]|nr:hypothetical protein FRB95_001601 [Tulasnella sp. JGI-2019a]